MAERFAKLHKEKEKVYALSLIIMKLHGFYCITVMNYIITKITVNFRL